MCDKSMRLSSALKMGGGGGVYLVTWVVCILKDGVT